MKCKCQNCGQEFQLNRMWQKFCCKQCQQQWNHAQYRADRVMAEHEARANGHANGNGPSSGDEEHRAKWKAIRAEWAEEDRQEAQQQPKFPRRF